VIRRSAFELGCTVRISGLKSFRRAHVEEDEAVYALGGERMGDHSAQDLTRRRDVRKLIVATWVELLGVVANGMAGSTTDLARAVVRRALALSARSRGFKLRRDVRAGDS